MKSTGNAMQIRQEKGCYTLYKENESIGTAVVDGTTILRLEVVPRWRGRGYGSYLLKELLRQNGGLDPKQATRFTAPLPRDAAGRALAQKYGFAPDGSQLVRRRVPDLSARAALPCVFDRTARPRRAVRGCHLRQRPRHAVPVYAGRPGRARAGTGYSTAGR